MVKVKFECWWTDTPSLNNRMLKQFIPNEDLEKYKIVRESPDYTIILGKTDWSSLETPKEKTFYFSQEPLWSPNQPHQDIHLYCSKIFISDRRDYPNEKEYIENLVPMLYAGRGETDYREEWDWSQRMFDIDYSKWKTKKISSVVTNSYNSYYFQFENRELNRIIYKNRVDIINKIIEDFPEINVWGTYQPNNGVNCHGDAWNKLIPLKEFKFSLCFENTIQKNYVSEKFWDCILTDTVPIYFGCSNISDYISDEYFINLTTHIDDYTYIKDRLYYIVENCDVLYQRYLEKIKKLKLSFKKDKSFNLWERIKFEIEKNEKDIVDNEILD